MTEPKPAREFFRRPPVTLPRDADGGGLAVVGEGPGKWTAILLLAFCEVLALALWFSAAAVIPVLQADYGLDDLQASLVSSSVSVGFVAGTLVSAVLGLADRIPPRRFFMVAVFAAAAANGLVVLFPPDGAAMPLLRFGVGVCMAGIYPVGMKIASSWAKGDMGLLVGLLVGALTLGSASPHLINAFVSFDWRLTLLAASALAALAGVLINFVAVGPSLQRAPKFEAGFVLQAWTRRAVRLANLGYFGHMWELYALWAWAGVYLSASFALAPGGDNADQLARVVTFVTIGIGAAGCLAGGYLADRLGRTAVTIGAMAISGACALLSGWLFGANPWLITALFLVWGFTVVADSAQFSASVMELSDPWLVGTMVTVQTSIGFLLTILTIHLVPVLVGWFGWRFGFMFLAIGPVFGIWAMWRLRSLPEARKLAGGRR